MIRPKSVVSFVVAALAGGLLPACASGGGSHDSHAAPEVQHAPAAESAVAMAGSVTTGWREATSEGLVVRWKPTPDPIPLNKLFRIDVEVSSATGGPVEGVTQMRVDARMPAHGHGMTRQASVTMDGSERAHAVGMLFHMVGDWEVSVDVYQDQRWISSKWTETLE